MTEDYVPPYVPPHLRGKVGDFRMEPGGQVSFSDPEHALGLGPEMSRKSISMDQYRKTFDENYRNSNLAESLSGQYASPIARQTNWQTDIRDRIAKAVRGGLEWGTTTQGRAVGTSALLSGLLGAGVGAWSASHQGESPWGKGALYALLAGTLGAGGTALLQHQNNKREAFLKSASMIENVVMQALSRDDGLTDSEKVMLLRASSKLRERDAEQLSQLLRGAAGAGAGMLIVKFLKLKGLLPMIAGGIIGAALAGRKSPRRNALGQLAL